MSRKANGILVVVGVVLLVVSIACFAGSSDAKSRLSNPQAIAYSLFNQSVAAQAQELRQMAELLHYGGILSVVGGGISITVGLVGLAQKRD
jgi:hypothetical protein